MRSPAHSDMEVKMAEGVKFSGLVVPYTEKLMTMARTGPAIIVQIMPIR